MEEKNGKADKFEQGVILYTGYMKMIRLWGPVVIWMVIIFFLSTRQEIQISDERAVNFSFFKTLHVIEYAILYLLSYRAVKNTLEKSNGVIPYAIAMGITLLYAASDEFHQTFVPTREGKVRDVIIDALGALTAWILLQLLLPRAPKILRVWAKRLQFL